MNLIVINFLFLLPQDGFEKAFVGAPVLRDEDQCAPLATLLRNVFTELRMLKNYEGLATNESATLPTENNGGRKKYARRTTMDPFAIKPIVDGRINNLSEVKG